MGVGRKAMITTVYRIEDGEILSVAHDVTPRAVQGCKTLEVDSSSIDPSTMKVDLATLKVVNKTAAEIALAALPTLAEVQNAIVLHLHATDAFMMPDRPLSDQVRDAWKVYRQTLRDLSKGSPAPSVADMIAAFPKRPDGLDTIGHLRARLLKVA